MNRFKGCEWSDKSIMERGEQWLLYKGVDTSRSGQVVIKVFDLKYKFAGEKEVKFCSQLNHKNILSIRYHGVYQKKYVIVMEYFDQTMKSFINKGKQLHSEHFVQLLQDLTNALANVEDNEISQCKLTTENIVLTYDAQRNIIFKISVNDYGKSKKSSKATAPQTMKQTVEMNSLGAILFGVATGRVSRFQHGSISFDEQVWNCVRRNEYEWWNEHVKPFVFNLMKASPGQMISVGDLQRCFEKIGKELFKPRTQSNPVNSARTAANPTTSNRPMSQQRVAMNPQQSDNRDAIDHRTTQDQQQKQVHSSRTRAQSEDSTSRVHKELAEYRKRDQQWKDSYEHLKLLHDQNKKKLQAAHNKVRYLDSILKERDSEKENLLSNYYQLLHECDELKQNLLQKENEIKSLHFTQMKSPMESNNNATIQCKQLQIQVNNLDNENRLLTEGYDKMLKKLEKANQQMKAEQDDLDEWQQYCESLEKKMKEIELNSPGIELQKQQLQQQINELSQQQKSSQEEVRQLNRIIQDLKNHQKISKDHEKQLQSQLENVQRQLQQQQNVSKSRWNERILPLQVDFNKAQQELTSLHQQNEALQNDLGSSKTRQREMQSRLVELQKVIEDLEKKEIRFEDNTKRLNERIKQLEIQLRESERQLNENKQQLRADLANAREFQQQHQSANESRLNEQIRQLQGELTKSHQEITNLHRQLAELNDKLGSRKDQARLSDRNKQLEIQLRDSEYRLNKQIQQLADLNVKLESSKDQAARLSERNKQLEIQLEKSIRQPSKNQEIQEQEKRRQMNSKPVLIDPLDNRKHQKFEGINKSIIPSISSKKYFEVPHSPQFFLSLISFDNNGDDCPVAMAQSVEVNFDINGIKSIRKGKVRWRGFHPSDRNQILLGVELELKTFEGGTDGEFPQGDGRRLFTCPERRGIVVPLKFVNFDRDELARSEEKRQRLKNAESNLQEKNPEFICGTWSSFNRDSTCLQLGAACGIQGRVNSCYIDSSLFAMFAFNDTFDFLLFSPQAQQSTSEVNELRRLLREGIVAPLRKNCFVRHANVMQFRELFQTISRSKGMTTDQKDAEEFMSTLFERVFQVEPFVKFQSGDNCHVLQLLCDNYSRVGTMPQLLDQFNDKFTTVPENFIVILPRERNKYLAFEMFDFSLELDLKRFVVDHRGSRCVLELHAILCIETSHYVSFVRNVNNHKWYLFDSMADRVRDYNVPAIVEVDGLEDWLTGDYRRSIQQNHSLPRDMNTHQRRLVTTAYILFYRLSNH